MTSKTTRAQQLVRSNLWDPSIVTFKPNYSQYKTHHGQYWPYMKHIEGYTKQRFLTSKANQKLKVKGGVLNLQHFGRQLLEGSYKIFQFIHLAIYDKYQLKTFLNFLRRKDENIVGMCYLYAHFYNIIKHNYTFSFIGINTCTKIYYTK